jgi:DNA invertase Pin-like site-specific DNA recombinase
MSTDLQQFSTENQLDTIRRYAEQRGYQIIRVFEDSGRSGLNIDGRDGLNSDAGSAIRHRRFSGDLSQ